MRSNRFNRTSVAVAAGIVGASGVVAACGGGSGAERTASAAVPKAESVPAAPVVSPPTEGPSGAAIIRVHAGGAAAARRVASATSGGDVRLAHSPSASRAHDAGSAAHTDHHDERPATETIVVRGGWINDGQCLPTSVKGGPTTFDIVCTGGSLWNGAWSGHTVSHVVGKVDVDGNLSGTYDEWFVGAYTADQSVGGLHFRGDVAVDGTTLSFQAHASIVESSCAFAGSSGRADYDGNAETGGYTATWTRSAVRPTAGEPCAPEVPPVP